MIDALPFPSPSRFAEKVLGVKPHKSQAEFIDAHAKVKVASCGRRWGKSFAQAVELIHFAVANPGSTQFVIAPTADQSNIIMGYVESMLQGSPVLRESPSITIVRSPFPKVVIRDSVIHARSGGDSGKNIRGHGADRVIFDEAAFIPDDVYAAVSPLLAQSPMGERVLISTPFGRNHFFDAFVMGESGEAGYRSFHYPSSTNPYLSADYLKSERLDKTSLQYEVEYEAIFHESQNSVFPWSLIQSCLRDDIDGEPLPGRIYVIGWDPAQYSDRSGVAVLDITDKPWKLVRCFDISGRDYPVQEAHIKVLHEEYGKALVLLDATSHAPVLQHLELAGVKATGFTFTNTTKREIIDGTVLAMEQAELVFPLIPDLREELLYYRYEITTSGNIKLGADAKHHDDLVTALALAVQAAKKRRPSEPAAPFVMAGSNRWGET